MVAALLLFFAQFATIASVDLPSVSCEVINDSNPALADRCDLSGFERHGPALLLVGLLALALAFAAGMYGSRPAAVALAAVGAIVLAIALLDDLPVTNETGALGRDFQGATASAGTGLYLELAAGALAIFAGAVGLVARPALVANGEPPGGRRPAPQRRAPPR